MKTRKLGTLEVSAIGMGCMGFSHAVGKPMPIEESADIVRKAIDYGFTYFDTAMNYGYAQDPNHNEKILGKAFEGIRDQVVISSKCGVTFDYEKDKDQPPLILNSTKKMIRESIEGSLERLKTDYIDLYFQARIDPNVEPEEVAETMQELMNEGKILHWGLSEANLDYMKRANAVCPLTAVENRYNIITRDHEAEARFLEENHIGWVAHGAISKGLLTGTFEKGHQFARDDWRSRQVNDQNIERYAPLIQYLHELAEEKNATTTQISLAWILAQKDYIVPIPGMRSEKRFAENAGAADIVLTPEEVQTINHYSETL